MYLCCDLGGTNARFAVFDPVDKTIVFRVSSKVRDHRNFYDLLAHTLAAYRTAKGSHRAITSTILGVAGPTNATQVRPTNIDGWEIDIVDTGRILRQFNHQPAVSIMNDFEALGYGILRSLRNGFGNDDYVQVYREFDAGKSRQSEQSGVKGTRSLICGPGTGLGLSCVVEGLLRDGLPYVLTSEGGHHSLAPESSDEYRFLGTNEGRFQGKRSYEAALSGPGLKNIYSFYRQADYGLAPDNTLSPAQIVLAASQRDAAAADSLAFFCRLLAQFCGNMVLTFNCDRTVFLWGGTLSAMPLGLLKSAFEGHFGDRCRHADRVGAVSVVLLQNHELPLLGCAYRAELDDENRNRARY